jgi:hypothetical protein
MYGKSPAHLRLDRRIMIVIATPFLIETDKISTAYHEMEAKILLGGRSQPDYETHYFQLNRKISIICDAISDCEIPSARHISICNISHNYVCSDHIWQVIFFEHLPLSSCSFYRQKFLFSVSYP